MTRLPALALLLSAAPALARPGGTALAQLLQAAGDAGTAVAVPSDACAPGRLAAALEARLTLPADAAERDRLRQVLGDLAASATGAELACAFVNEGRSAVLAFDDLPGELESAEGSHLIVGVAAVTDRDAAPPRVRVNRLYLRADPARSRTDLAASVAHELLGHALEAQRSAAAGVPRRAYFAFRGDEEGGRLIGWLVRADRGGPFVDAAMWDYLEDREGYFRAAQSRTPAYAVSLTAAEMGDARSVIRAREAALDAAAAEISREAEDARRWSAVFDHFVDAHGLGFERGGHLRVDIDQELAWNELSAAQLARARTAVISATVDLEHGSGAAALREAAGHPYFAEAESRIALRAEALRARVRGLSRPARPWPQGALDWEGLRAMYREDRAVHPDHFPGEGWPR